MNWHSFLGEDTVAHFVVLPNFFEDEAVFRQTFERFPAKFQWSRSQWNPRHFSPEQHEVRRLHPQRVVRFVVLSNGTTMSQGIFLRA